MDESTESALMRAGHQITKLQTELDRVTRERDIGIRIHDECSQIAGKALGYPWFKDDQKNFPGATEEAGVCIGEHVTETIVAELAAAYTKQRQRAEAAEANIRAVIESIPSEYVVVSREGAGHEDVNATLAISVAKVCKRVTELEQTTTWIPVSERLPTEPHRPILALCDDGDTVIWSSTKLMNGKDYVTHWFPVDVLRIPQPEAPAPEGGS